MQYITLQGNIFNVSEENLDAFLKKYPGAQLYTPEGEDDADLSSPRIKNPTIQDPKGGFYNVLGKTYQVHEHDYDAFVKKFGDDIQYLGKEDDTKTDQEIAIDQINSVKGDGYHFNQNESNTLKFLRASFGEYGFEFDGGTWGGDNWIIATGPDGSTQNFKTQFDGKDGLNQFNNFKRWASSRSNLKRKISKHEKNVIYHGAETNTDKIIEMDEETWREWFKEVLPLSGFQAEDSGSPGDAVDFILPNVGIMHSNLQPNFDGDNDLNRFFAISGSAKGERAIMQYILDVAKDRHANPHKYAVYTDFVGTQGGEGITLDDSVGISYLPKNFAALKKMYKTVGLDIKNVSGRGAPLYVIEKDGVEIFRGRNTPGTARITDYQNLSVGNENNFRGDGYKENLADFLFNYNFTQEEYDKLAVERQKIFKNRKNLSKGKGYSSTEKMLQHDMEDYQNIGKASTYLEITETKKLKDEIDKQAGALQIKIEKDQNILKKEMEDLAQQAKDEGITSVSYNETLGIYEVEGSNEEIVAKYSRLFNDHKQKVDLNRDLYNEAVDELMDKHQTILDQFEYLGEEAAALEKNYNWGNNMASRFQMGWKEITLGIGSIFGDKPAKRLQDLQAIQHNRYETLEWKGWDVEEGKWLTALSYMGAELTPTVLTTLVPGVAAMRGLGASVQAARWIYTGGAALQAIGSTSAEMRQAHMNVDEWKDQLKELDELHKKGKISDEVYNSTKVKLSELIIENDYSVAQSLSQVGLSGIIEGGFTYLMGANVFTKMFTPKYLGPGMSKIDDGLALLNKTNHKARMQFLGQTVFGMGTEVLEETLIYTFDQASRNVILDKEFNLDALPQVVYGSALMGGPMAGTGAFVQTVKTHALTKEMRTQWQDINRQIEENNLKMEKLGSDPKNQWKYEALLTKGINLRKQLGKVNSEIEAVALVLGKQNMGRLILAGRNLEDMAAKAGVDSHLSDAEKNKLIKKYVEAQMEEDPIAARKFMAEWNEALEIKNSIIGDVDFDGSIKKLFGLRGEEVLEKLMNIDPKLKDATEREKFLAVYDELKKDATARHIGASRSREDNNRWVEEQVYGEGGFKPPYKRNIKAENDYHEMLGSVQEVDGVDAVMMYEAEEISTQKILRNKDLQNLTTVEAKTDEELEAAIRKAVDFAIERDLAEMRKTTPNEQDQQAKEAVIRAKANTLVFRLVDKLKTGKTNAFVVDDKYIVRDKKAGDAARKEGNLLAGTVLSHEISHAIDYLAFDQAGITNYGKLLYEYMEKNHPNIHAQAVAIQANIGNFNPFNNTFPKGEAKFYDEYSKEVQTALLYNKTEKAKLIKNHDVASGAWTRMMNKKEGFEITKPKHAAIYLASFLKGWERGEVGALQKRRIKYRKEKGLTSDIEGIKQSSNLQSMLDVDYEGDVKKMGRDAVSVDAQGKRLSIPDLTMSKLGQDIGAMVEDITKKLYDPILEKGELTRNEYKNALIGIASEIIRTENFDPTKQSLDKFVSSRLYLRANALAKQLGVPQEFLKDIANITDPTVDPDDDVDTKDEPAKKARVLNNFDIELEDGLVDAEIIAEVEALIEENPADLEARMERLILNDIRKKLDKTVGKIAKNKQTGKREPTPEYEVFIRNEYEEIVQSLGIKTIRTAYKTWFTQEKTGVKKYKNIREDGSVSNYVKATQINSTNKREYIRWFLEGKPGSLTERRTALLRRIARKKAEIAIDDYIERNSSNLDAVIDAKLRSLTRTAENIADEQASFDSIKFSENTKKKLKVYRLQTKKAADGSGRIIPRFQTAGHALEQVIIDQLVEWGWNLDLLDVEFMHTTNRGGLIDVILNVTDINTGKSRAVNMEVKMNKKVRMSSVLVSDYNLNYGDEQSFNLANDVYSDLSPYAEMLVNARESIMNLRNAYNRKIDAYNRKHGTKEPYLKYGGRMVDKIYHDPEIAKLRAAVRKNSYVFDDATPLIEHNLAKNVEIIEIFGMGLYSFEKNSSLTNPITGIGPKYIGETTAKVRAALGVKNTGRKRKQVEGVKTIIRNKAGDAYIDFRLQFQNTLINFKSTKENKSPISITNQQDVIGMFGIKQSQSGSLPFAAMKASENAKTPKKYHEQSRGMSTFDFDETLIIDGENFIVAKDPITGEKIKISSADWPIKGPRLAEQGYTFDFSDFVNVRGGVDGPLLQKMKNQIKKYGAKNVFVLTARPQSSAVAIHSWLKSKKINIPLENITGLGNSTGAAKAEWMLKKFAQGYNDM
jgi:ribosomal protein S11